jgi:hypothetical protein
MLCAWSARFSLPKLPVQTAEQKRFTMSYVRENKTAPAAEEERMPGLPEPRRVEDFSD